MKIDISNYGYARYFKFVNPKIIVPTIEVSSQFEEIAKSLYNQIKNNVFETMRLGRNSRLVTSYAHEWSSHKASEAN